MSLGGECGSSLSKDKRCWCKDPSIICRNNEFCFEGQCFHLCNNHPSINNVYGSIDRCHCHNQTCDSSQVCNNNACEPRPNNCTQLAYTGSNECSCIGNHTSGHICKEGEMCIRNKCLRGCPKYPEVTLTGCVCGNNTECSSGDLCTENGICRTPAECQDPTRNQTLNLRKAGDFQTITETLDITLSCMDCHHFQHDPDVVNVSIQCQADWSWNDTIHGCIPTECSRLTINDTSVQETTTGEGFCHTDRTFQCKNELEFFSFASDLPDMSYACTPR